MYNRNEMALIKQDFWTSFGKYMLPVQSAVDEKINWINYKTGIKGIFFKMNAGKDAASLSIQMTGEKLQREKFFERMIQFRALFESTVPGEWIWVKEKLDENGRSISVIETILAGVNVYDKNDWPAIIPFLKSRITGLDEFWTSVKDFFEMED